MMKLMIPAARGYTIRGVDDWLCFMTDAAGAWHIFITECDPLWAWLPADLQRHALGVEDDADLMESSHCIAFIALRKLQLGQTPEPCDPECLEDTKRHFA